MLRYTMDYLRHLIGSNYEDPDVKRTVRELVESRGFKLENHHVTTDDGYILTLHRLVNPHHNHNNGRPLLLQHGFGSCSVHWMVNSADGHAVPCADSSDIVNDNVSNNTAFALSNGGFDVWLGNFRGNHYSAKHKRLTTDDLSYWDFSIDELVQYDLPAMIDHILETTGQPSIRYIGFSQGTTAMFGLLSEKPEYNAKLKPYIAMAPIISYYNSTSLIGWLPRVLAAIHGEHGVAMPTGLNRLMSTGRLMGSFLARPWQIFNHHVLGLGFGFNYDQIDWERLPVVASRPFGDLSYKSFRHHTQLRESGQPFSKFDYGKEKNLTIYGTEIPPQYDLSKITCKHIGLICGLNDNVTPDKDVDILRNSLKVPLIFDVKVKHDRWSHLDFHFGKDVGKLVNAQLIDFLNDIDNDNIRGSRA